MSGHSKWATIKHKKGAADAKRGKIFTKLIKEITVAARMGGGDITGNPRLRSAVDKAKGSNMPNDTIDRAIKKGTGELEGVTYEEITYEGRGPKGVALIVECLTDNKNRTVAELKHVFQKHNGAMDKPGSVMFLFEKKGQLRFDKEVVSEDQMMEAAMEAGVDDYVDEGEAWLVDTTPSVFTQVKEAFVKAGLTPVEAEVAMVPKLTQKLEGHEAAVTLRLYEALDDHDDVQNVYANFDIDEDALDENA
jgi:YebC/PmpR family DNA-binding regulatory protein